MTFADLKKDLDQPYQKMSKRDFIQLMRDISYYGDPKTRVGGPKGKGRITVKRALALLGA